MKQVYIIGSVVKFTYREPSFFKKHDRKDGSIIRKVRFVYAESELAAKKKYQENFFNECDTYDKAIKESTTCDGFDPYEFFCNDEKYDIKIYENEIKLLTCNVKQTIDDYKSFMLPEDFRDWWWDGCEQNAEKEINIQSVSR